LNAEETELTPRDFVVSVVDMKTYWNGMFFLVLKNRFVRFAVLIVCAYLVFAIYRDVVALAQRTGRWISRWSRPRVGNLIYFPSK
jgi:hypothetical protein